VDDGLTSKNAEVVFEEIQDRRARGEDPDVEDYCRRYPDLADGIRWLESLRAASGAGASLPTGSAPLGEGLRAARGASWERFEELAVHAGQRVGRYTILASIGSGGFGAVFRARQEEPVEREVAIKVLRAGAGDRETLGRFKMECQVLATLEHPGVAKLFDAGVTDGGQPYYVMEHIPGKPITIDLDDASAGIGERLGLFLGACDAIHHAHRQGIIHRDIKPHNVLVVRHDGRPPLVKVIDFGLAKALGPLPGADSLHTRTGFLAGTPAFMSPEQTMGDGRIDTRTDVYSLGVLLFEILTGVLPLAGPMRGASVADLRRIICEVEPPSLSSAVARIVHAHPEVAARRGLEPEALKRKLRGELDWIVGRALEKDRDRRYESVRDLAGDVENYIACKPVRARSPGIVYRGRKFVERHRAAAAVIGIVLCAAAGWALGREYLEWRSFLKAVDGAEAAAARGELADARLRWSGLRERYPERPETARVGAGLVTALCDAGEGLWNRARERSAVAERLRGEWRSERDGRPTSSPVWERETELALWKKFEEERAEITRHYNEALLLLHGALDVLPSGRDQGRARNLLGGIYHERHRALEEDRSLEDLSGFFKTMLETHGDAASRAQLAERGVVRVRSDPPGAEVHVFRYEEREARLLPLPFDVGRGRAAAPSLRVDRVRDAERSPFRARDRLLTVRGLPVHTWGDVLRAIRAPHDATVEVVVERGGREVTFPWTPFGEGKTADGAPEAAPAVPGFDRQLGVTFEAYPVALDAENHAGVTSAETDLEIELPAGSYLLVLARDGHEDTRHPVRIPSEGGSAPADAPVTLRLVRTEDVPPGFVYIPGGLLSTGGDPMAFQPLERALEVVPEFFIARFELSTEEWLEFVNDPAVARRTDDLGRMEPESPSVRQTLAKAGLALSVQAIPKWGRTLYWLRADGAWTPDPRYYRREWPILCISQLAASEYVHWRSERARERGEPWRYRLPSDVEWERAARGVDRRHFVWGSYLVWSFCWSDPGIPLGEKPPAASGAVSFDESVFGVRDMNGSVNEHTTGRPIPGRHNTSYRGGSYLQFDEEYFRISSRNSLLPWEHLKSSGVRLVAERVPESAPVLEPKGESP
jgi:formylglycine-generating enzyme required for sulfatase activity